jgi:hypothetical protein
MTTTHPTATLDIETVDRHGRPLGVFHATLLTLNDALHEVARFTPAPPNRWVRERLQADGGGRFSIGQFTVAISVLP